MILFILAHKGEAQTLLQKKNFRLYPLGEEENIHQYLYFNEDEFLLLTGEGWIQTLQRLTIVCTVLKNQGKNISHFINLGVAGALDPSLDLLEIIQVRTAYLEPGSFQHTQSFSTLGDLASQTSLKRLDCITAHNRVQRQEKAQSLFCFAPVVDRELWAIAITASLFQIPFSSYKLLIDRAVNFECLDFTKKQYEEFAELLANFALTHFTVKKEKRASPLSKDKEKEKHLLEGFYFTTTQERLLKQYYPLTEFSQLSQDFDLEFQQIIENIKQKENHPKKRTQKLIEQLQARKNPFRKRLKEKLEPLCRPFSNDQLQFDPHFEDPKLQFHFKIKNEKDFQKMQKLVANFPYQKVRELLDGKNL